MSSTPDADTALASALIDELAERDLKMVEVGCECNEGDVYWRGPDFPSLKMWAGEMFVMREAKKLLALCSDCSHIRLVVPTPHEVTDDTYTLRFNLTDIVLPAEEAAEGTTSMFNRRLDEAVGLDPNRLISCYECQAPIYKEDKQAGPGAPELGWEFYQCSECDETYSCREVEENR